MSKTPEGKVKLIVKTLLDRYNTYWFMPPANGFGRAGIPDFIGCYKGQFFAVECKAGKGQTTALQDRELSRIHSQQGVTFIVTDDYSTVTKLELWLLKFGN